MGRHAAFDKNQVLDNALMLFWSRGFAASSLRQLEEVTELHPGSLYHHFENKEGLYLHALKFYIDHYLQQRLQKHLYTGNPLDGLRRFLTCGYRQSGDLQFQNCCFLACTSTELHLLPPEAKQMIRQSLDTILQAISRQLEKGVHKNLLHESLDVETTATEILSLYLSLQLRARIQVNQHQLDNLVKQHLQRTLKPTI